MNVSVFDKGLGWNLFLSTGAHLSLPAAESQCEYQSNEHTKYFFSIRNAIKSEIQNIIESTNYHVLTYMKWCK